MSDLWAACEADNATVDFPWVDWGGLFNQNMEHSFENGDEMPDGVKKLSHSQGVVAKVSWEPIGNANGYTGIMGTGSENILMRLSETSMLHEESSGLQPSAAFKFLRDGTFSDNIVAMPSFEGSDSWNFLENPMLTRVDAFLTIHNEDGTSTQD